VKDSPLRIRYADPEEEASRPEWKRIGLELKAWHCGQGELEIAHRGAIVGEIELRLPTELDHRADHTPVAREPYRNR
jgi:hypothetical protein